MRTLSITVWAVSLTLLATACGIQSMRADNDTAQAINQMDVTIGSYGQGREAQLILVTMESDIHARLINEGRITSTDNSPSELPEAYRDFLQNLQSRYGLTRVADWPLATLGIRCLVFESNGSLSVDQITNLLSNEDLVETAQAMQLFDVQQIPEYNDPYASLQHGFLSMQAAQSHQWARGDGISVAVIDTGVDTTHPDLTGKAVISRNFVDSEEASFLADIHGTAVAGVIAATANNDTGMVGIAPDSSLLALKACWQLQTGHSDASCNTFTLAKALNFSIANEVDIINLSLAGPRDPLLERLITEALDRNIIVIGAVGPGGIDRFPTVVPGTLAVVSNNSPGEDTISAPGQRILSTQPGDDYGFFNGSSFSAAHVAGLAALVLELDSSTTPDELQTLLTQNTDPVTQSANACLTLASLTGPEFLACTAEP